MGTKALESCHQRVMGAVLAKLYTMSYNTHVVTHTNKDRVIIFCASTIYSATSLLFLLTSSNQICVVLHCFTTSSSNAIRRSLLQRCLSLQEKLCLFCYTYHIFHLDWCCNISVLKHYLQQESTHAKSLGFFSDFIFTCAGVSMAVLQ